MDENRDAARGSSLDLTPGATARHRRDTPLDTPLDTPHDTALDPAFDAAFAVAGHAVRPGFAFDILGLGRYAPGEREALRERLSGLVALVFAELGFDLDDTRHHARDAGLVVRLPDGVDTAVLLPGLVTATTARLARDNRRHRERLRVAVGRLR